MSKKEILMANGTYNKNHSKVTKDKFINDPFFDPMDIVQVKYEMLKTAKNGEQNISQIAYEFGFSRAAFYKIKTSFNVNGIYGLVPEKSGPQKPRKLTGICRNFIDKYISDNPGASSFEITQQLKKELGIEISKRTIERYRSYKKHS